mmetsp:Transcript_47447/g.122798  ORF Transcript_47447/g.122798 Transcript_47447/m.122798 type:complete len:84 (-) Transcript_47447:4368-4619(-)
MKTTCLGACVIVDTMSALTAESAWRATTASIVTRARALRRGCAQTDVKEGESARVRQAGEEEAVTLVKPSSQGVVVTRACRTS